MNTLEFAKAMASELDTIRKDLHRHPELGNHEFWTRDYLESYLKGLGLEVKRVLDTGLVAVLHGTCEGATVAVRADMDALPVCENTGCDFSSENENAMHACGHDIHMTAALGCAKILSKNLDAVHGDVIFVFQPDEEGSGGAKRIIETGILEGVCAVFGGHVAPDLPLGTVGVRYGKFYAASDVFTITVTGKSCHGATPEKGTNALLAASKMVAAFSELKPESDDRFVLSVCQFESGHACNVIAPSATFSGILRTLGPVNRAKIKQMMAETVQKIAKDYGVTADVNIRASYGGIVNTGEETRLLEDSAKLVLGEQNVRILEEPTMTTEDFGYFTERYSGSFCHIGCGCDLPLHNDRFLPKIEAAVYATAVYAQTVINYLD